ncbi:MAG TPA: PilZ domain-containing protein [Planctomycetota bacterium]
MAEQPGPAAPKPGNEKPAAEPDASNWDGEQENRRGPRVRVSALATLETTGLNATNQAVCTVRDLSRSGIGLETGQPPEVGQVVRLRLVLNEQMITISAITTRVERRGKSNFYAVGLDWSRCKQEELVFLDEVLKAVEPPARAKGKPGR